ncbi:hypothetical protein LZF95_06025 [Algoriphagus sp. AGSA1]|uniref:hypothetical protein n=1 Tax=Algoriphagus sp. AGSA1 TaxID=2907213 RepID=UPI001F467518|nr:hypothetical protein [Algoriphagus sp. AGSA1]MCE7054225.1 hypothetical protein [Algoriphagus sp. AGSA1]
MSVCLLNQFKAAAIKSESVVGFINYFDNSDMYILEKLNDNDIQSVYLNFYKGPLSKYFQELDSSFGNTH